MELHRFHCDQGYVTFTQGLSKGAQPFTATDAIGATEPKGLHRRGHREPEDVDRRVKAGAGKGTFSDNYGLSQTPANRWIASHLEHVKKMKNAVFFGGGKCLGNPGQRRSMISPGRRFHPLGAPGFFQ
jgi:hypothetical protein